MTSLSNQTGNYPDSSGTFVQNLVITKTIPPPMKSKATTTQQPLAHSLISKRDDVRRVNDHPTPIASINGTIAAELPAPNRYWTMYFVQMTSAFLAGFTSGDSQYLTRKKTWLERKVPAVYVFNALNVPIKPTPAQNAATIGNANPPILFCRPHPNNSNEIGKITNNPINPLLSLSPGKRMPFRLAMYRFTVRSDRRPPTILPTKKPMPGAM